MFEVGAFLASLRSRTLTKMVFNLFHSFTSTLPFIFALSAAAFNNTVYIISNAETPSLGLPGLTPIGLQRANDCLPSVR
jgi:hypothetical protein